MEPCAPGTEDDPPIMYSTLTKKENEQDRLLSQKAFLRNGKYDNVFELSYQNGSEHWYCKACECPVRGRVFQHEAGKRHMFNISNTHHNLENLKKEASPEEPVTVEVAPGEPLPPGFEEIGRISQIQERLDGFKVGPLIALEYLIELQDDDCTKEPFYLCILCDKKGDPRTVLTHLSSYNHISQYLQKHFPTCWRALCPYNTKQYRRNWQTALQKIAEGIEKKFGRLKPFPIDKESFKKDRMHFLQIIGKGRHFSEHTGYTFEELIIHDELTKTHEEEKSFETSSTNNWGSTITIQKPFKKRSPSPPVVGIPSKRNKGNAQTNPRRTQEPAYVPASSGPNKPQIPPTKPQQSSPSGIPQNKSAADRLPTKQSTYNQAVKQPVRRRSLSSVSSLSDDTDDDKERFGRDKNRRDFQKSRPVYEKDRQLPYGRRRSPSPKRRSPFRRRSPSPRRRISPRHRSKSPSRRPSPSSVAQAEQEKERLRKIEEFRKLSRAIENDMHKTLKQHEKNPEKHPQYNEEWKKFWNRRYKELKATGVDVTKHDFKPEWIEFWNKRMIEIHSDELRTRKEALRKRLALPDEMNPIKFKIGANQEKITIKPLPMAAQPDQDNEVIIIDDKDDDKGNNDSWEHIPNKNRGGPVRKPVRRSMSPKRDSPVRYTRRSRSRSRERPHKSSLPQERSKFRNPPPNETSRASRPTKRSNSRERFSGRRSRSRSGSGSGDTTSVKRSISGDRIVASRTRNLSPISVNSNVSRSKETSRGRDRDYKDSRERSLSRNRSPPGTRGSSPYSKKFKEKRSISRERSWERERKRPSGYRESSFERDLRGRERIRTVADLPWERDSSLSVYRNPYLPPPIMRDVTRKPVDVGAPIIPADDEDDEKEVNVVDVLRLLTALEERLGSLGPKIIDLLAQALALEKNESNSSESLLDNDINCVLFETVKEKLKGQLFAGLVDMVQERAFKRAIKKIASLMHLAGQRKKQREKLLPKVDPVTVPGVGAIDKAAIARQIANALVAQGKTDVSQGELEQLINAVVGMAEASKNTSKPMTTSNFLQMLSGGNVSFPESEDKIIIPTAARKADVIDLEKLTEPLTPSPGKSSSNNMENLSDSDLQTLLQNFKDLSTEEQHNLINYLKKLEYQEPERVERLRKFVNLETGGKTKDDTNDEAQDENKDANSAKKDSSGRDSPFSKRAGGLNPANELIDIDSEEELNDKDGENKESTNNEKQQTEKKLHDDSEEDEYTFEDVVKTVSKNVKDKEMEHSKKVLEETMKYDKSKADTNLSSAKDLISHLMGNIAKNNSNSSSIDLLGLGGGKSITPSNQSTSMTHVDFTKLSGINVANLASIVNNVRNFASNENEQKLAFRTPSPTRNTHKLNFDLTQLKPESPGKERSGILPTPGNRGPLTLNLLDRSARNKAPERPFIESGPKRGPEFSGDPSLDFERQRYGGPGGPDRFGVPAANVYGGPDRFGGPPERFGGPAGTDRFGQGQGGPDRFGGPGGPDRFGPSAVDRFGGTGGPDRFGGPGGPDRFGGADRFGGPAVPDRFGGPAVPDRFGGPAVPDRFGGPAVPDRFGGPAVPDRFGGPAVPDRFGGSGGPDRGFAGPDRGFERFGGPDRNFSGPDRGFGPGPLDRGIGESRMSGLGGPDRGHGLDRMGGQFRGQGPIDPKNLGNLGPRNGPPFGNDMLAKGPQRPGQNEQRNFQKNPGPDFNRPGGNFGRW